MGWYHKIVNDLGQIVPAMDWFEKELVEAKKEVRIVGRLEDNSKTLPGIVEHRYGQLQELEAILEYLNIHLRAIRKKHFKLYLENYARALTSRDVEKYVDGEPEVIDQQILINEVALMRNKWLGIHKGLDQKSWMLGHISRLRAVGLEDASI